MRQDAGSALDDEVEAVQRLLDENGQTRHNGSDVVRHTFVLSRGILHCGRCGTSMDGRSGTGRLGTKYFYYVCKRKECSLLVGADEIEGAVLDRLRHLASDGPLLDQLTEETNTRLRREKPGLRRPGLQQPAYRPWRKGSSETGLAPGVPTCRDDPPVNPDSVGTLPLSYQSLAPGVGFEPTTRRLTAGCSTAELSGSVDEAA